MLSIVKIISGMRIILFLIVILNLNTLLFSQSFSIKGQSWVSQKYSEEKSVFIFQLGYIPTLSMSYELSNNNLFDVEWAYNLNRSIKRSNNNDSSNYLSKPYRGWIRFSTKNIEARLGLQKIVFGPAQLIRPLAWFDTIDPKNPTAQTEGVDAFRLKIFPSNSVVLWTWILNGKADTLSYGGRAEISTKFGEWGFTFHQDPTRSMQIIGQYPVVVAGPHKRFGVDYRFDGYFGFWLEGTGFISDRSNIFNMDRQTLFALGNDYTIPIGSGLLIMLETLRSEEWSITVDDKNSKTISSIMTNLPIGIFHQFMFISNLDWDNDLTYSYLRWTSTYDHYSVNVMASVNTEPEHNSVTIMLIYNH